MYITKIVNLSARAWSLPILAALDAGTPGRQAPLLTATGAGRTAFAASLTHLMGLGLVERTPGHGHPLRPEFRLTAAGVETAALAGRLMQLVPQGPDAGLLRRSWSLPVLALTQQPQRFSTLRKTLNPITDRALATTLQDLEARHWLRRDINLATRHPFPTYQAENAGQRIAQLLAA